jgi:hypothetical protein
VGCGSPVGQAAVNKAMNAMATVYPSFTTPIRSLFELQTTPQAGSMALEVPYTISCIVVHCGGARLS